MDWRKVRAAVTTFRRQRTALCPGPHGRSVRSCSSGVERGFADSRRARNRPESSILPAWTAGDSARRM